MYFRETHVDFCTLISGEENEKHDMCQDLSYYPSSPCKARDLSHDDFFGRNEKLPGKSQPMEHLGRAKCVQ